MFSAILKTPIRSFAPGLFLPGTLSPSLRTASSPLEVKCKGSCYLHPPGTLPPAFRTRASTPLSAFGLRENWEAELCFAHCRVLWPEYAETLASCNRKFSHLRLEPAGAQQSPSIPNRRAFHLSYCTYLSLIRAWEHVFHSVPERSGQ